MARPLPIGRVLVGGRLRAGADDEDPPAFETPVGAGSSVMVP